MGQYFKIFFLSDDGKFIRAFICPRRYGNGSKLMEHAWIGTEVMKIVELILSSHGMFYKSRVVWAGDYAEPELEKETNLFHMTEDVFKEYKQGSLFSFRQDLNDVNTSSLRYIVNHTKRQYVDKLKEDDKGEDQIHPLPLLTYEGEEAYHGSDTHLCHTWARDIISMDSDIPAGYEELTCNFEEW